MKVHSGGGIESNNAVTTKDVNVEANRAKEEAKYESQSTTIITAEDIAKTQAKSVEDIIFNETGVSRQVDAMGRVSVSIRGAEPRHTLILIDGQPVMGDISKYQGQGDELQRLGTENVERIEIVKGAASAKYGSDAIGGVINIITRQPSATPGVQLNVEGRRSAGDGDIMPYQNFFLRGDSGQIGKLKFAVYGSKRDIMPVYGKETHVNSVGERYNNSLRFYGDIKNIGLSGTYEFNENHKIDVNVDRTQEDLERVLTYMSDDKSPMQHFKRNVTRDKNSIVYTGRNDKSDWKVSYDYAKMNEDDLTLTSQGYSKYEGKNTLNYVDDVQHKQRNYNVSANTQVNDKHLLSYGFGYTKESATGSRLKNAPNTWIESIEPWDYDKNLHADTVISYDDDGNQVKTYVPSSNVHAYPFTYVNGVPQYDQAYDLYGYKDANGNTVAPAYTYEDYYKYGSGSTFYTNMSELAKDPNNASLVEDITNRYHQFGEELSQEYFGTTAFREATVLLYYNGSGVLTWHGKKFQEQYNDNNNKVIKGRANINKYNFYLGDTWQVNDDTILTPIVRFDHSSLFGSHVTANMGLTHNIGGKANKRFKANVGTAYTEPGMGELYYNWEMYAGHITGDNEGRLGYYWIGNPNLKPEKSVNFDIGLEQEHGNTATRFNVFHNRIKDYMTTYFTGYVMDWYPNVEKTDPSLRFWTQIPDKIYSFRNIGRAEITGIEAEVRHQFNKHWSGKLGYTYLHAINKSDPDMPRQLLNKPTHKIDIGLTYENKGWRASIWSNYYINMLDSNSLAGGGSNIWYDGNQNKVIYNFESGKKQHYEKKTYSIWNILVQKELSKDAMVYVGIDNVLDHRDDDQAFQQRVYKIGANFKFGPSRKAMDKALDKAAGKATVRDKDEAESLDTDWFIQKPFDTEKKIGAEIIGDYRARWNAFDGQTNPEARVTMTSSIGTAEKNMFDKAGHGFEQRLRLGIDARISENTNVKILGSASGMSGVDTMYDVSDSKGLNHQRIETVDITQHANKWDFSVGRLTEPMGVTGYWFGKEYDGGRAVWTSGKNQLRLGYGDFRHSTGITDSAYTHATVGDFYRAPTKEEFLGIYDDNGIAENPEYDGITQRLAKASSYEEARELLASYLHVIKEKNPDGYSEFLQEAGNGLGGNVGIFPVYKVVVTENDTGNELGTYMMKGTDNLQSSYESALDMVDKDKTYDAVSKTLLSHNRNTYTIKGYDTNASGKRVPVTSTYEFMGFGEYSNTAVSHERIPIESYTNQYHIFTTSPEEAVNKFYSSSTMYKSAGTTGLRGPLSMMLYLLNVKWNPEDGSSLPLTFLADGSLGLVHVENGTILEKDTIPSIERAFFAQYKHQFGNTFGVQAWYLRSVNDDTHSYRYAKNGHNETASFDELASVIGVGAKWRIGSNLTVSYDWGQNRTDFGRFMNGSTTYAKTGTTTFDVTGRDKGGTPRFWVARIDVGHTDTDVPGSWNVFADYKYFQHGSFFGGNGTEALPDRYLDGIKSFTIGGGYVPAKNFLLEAFYTFGAKGINKRDTLYGAERFTLGDYTRIQATYKF